MDELKRCPFCDGEAHTYRNNFWWVACERANHGCVTMGAFLSEEEAVAAWNRRAKDAMVRCRDCVHSRNDGTFCVFFAAWYTIAGGDEYQEMSADVEPDGFCKWGRKRSKWGRKRKEQS